MIQKKKTKTKKTVLTIMGKKKIEVHSEQ
jgi:hypothetical protein